MTSIGCTDDAEAAAETDAAADSDGSSNGSTSGPSTDPEQTTGQTSTSTASTASSSNTASTSSSGGTTTDAGSTSSASSDDSTGDDPTTGGVLEPGCPEPLPGDWILCEDFEAAGDPSTYFGNFWTTGELMGVEATDAFSGAQALRIGHDPAVFASGMADIRFGQGPSGGLVHAPDQEYREVWVRFVLRTEDAWPDAGIAEAVEVMSVFGNARAIAVDATIYSPSQVEAQALAWSCVHDSQLLCNGQGDWSNASLEVRDGALGQSPLYGTQKAGQWQCHEIHVRLDDPGQANGVFEVFVDGQQEVSLQDIEYVDAWAGAGLNNVRFSSFWNAPAQLVHHVDDVVVSTSPLGC